MDLYITDGYTATKTIPAQAGLFPEVVAVYRPAASLDRHRRMVAATAEQIDKVEVDVIKRHLVSLNSSAPGDPSLLKPQLRAIIIDVLLGYVGSDEEKADLKN